MPKLAEKLSFYLEHDYNVLLTGRHGVGKTSIIKSVFDQHKIKARYFSAATMDPWVDFIGVPKERIENGQSFLDLVRPKDFQNGQVEAIFFDEFNRSHPKVRNAVMELIQFKSVNGVQFKNLRVVWAAINPAEEDYNVDQLDPAQADRFHIQLDVPFEIDRNYFISRYDIDLVDSMITWWSQLPNDIQSTVSPRRIEYGLDVYARGGDLRDVMPNKSNVSKLTALLKVGSFAEKLIKLLEARDSVALTNFFRVENNYAVALPWVLENSNYFHQILPVLPKEKFSQLLAKNGLIYSYVLANRHQFTGVVGSIIHSNLNPKLCNKLRRDFPTLATTPVATSPPIQQVAEVFFVKNPKTQLTIQDLKIAGVSSDTMTQTNLRVGQYKRIHNLIPEFPTFEVTTAILDYLNVVAKKSHANSLAKHYPDFCGILNHCLNRIQVLTSKPNARIWDENVGRHIRRKFDQLSTLREKVTYGCYLKAS